MAKENFFLETHRDHLILVNSVFIFIFQVNLPNVDFFLIMEFVQ